MNINQMKRAIHIICTHHFLYCHVCLHVNEGFFFRAIEMRRKQNIGAECECIANSMVTFLKFLLTYSMQFVKIYSVK